MKTVSLHTLGCRLNQAETATIAKHLTEFGFRVVPFGDRSDLTVINTCTVTEQADAKCRDAVRRSIRRNPDTYVAVIGCYAQMAVDTISGIEGVDLIVGNEHKMHLGQYLNGLEKTSVPTVVHSPKISRNEFVIESTGLYDNRTRANLKVQDGCNFVCSFCIIPKARGPARSRQFPDILTEARQLAEAGHQELVLTGVNIGTYRSGGSSFTDILKQLVLIDGLKRIRISSIEPTTIDRDVIRFMADEPKLCPHLHIPLQSGDDTILKAMRRKYTASEFAEFVNWANSTVPHVGIGTDVMVGYPGESDVHFGNTRKLLADLPIFYLHVFTYSDRSGTGSFNLVDKVSSPVKKQRNRILREMSSRKKKTYQRSFLGRTEDVLFEEERNGQWTGLTANYLRVSCKTSGPLQNQIRKVNLEFLADDKIMGTLL